MSTGDKYRLHAIVEGHVQGVGFRYYVLEIATPLGLTGWVRNTREGDVEVLAEGEHQPLEKLLEKLRLGPRAAYVAQVRQEWSPATGEFASFDVARTV